MSQNDVQQLQDHPHNLQFVGVCLLVALERLGGELTITPDEAAAAMQKGFVSTLGEDASITLKLEPVERIEAMAQGATQTEADDTLPTIGARVIRCLHEQLGTPIDDIKPELSLVDDLGADSLDTVEILMELESEFEIEIGDGHRLQLDLFG